MGINSITNYNITIEMTVLTEEEKMEVIENNTLDENIDRVIWTLYPAPEYKRQMIEI